MASATAAPIPNMGQLSHTDSAPQTSSPTSSSLGEPLLCQWQGCTAPNHPSAEALYHIGRKSTNNLNLQCFWGSCRTTTVKRDHITSHIRVHVPLKPHKCDFCGKSFKRPQDLKKHVKTHADESVLFNSPQNNATNPQQAPNGYQASTNGKNGAYDVQHNQHLNYPYANNHGPYGGNNAIPAGNFSYLSGYNNQSSYVGGGVQLTESRKRTHDALNDFFGDVKRRNIDGGQYQDLGARFSQFLNWFAPMSAAGAGAYAATNAFGPAGYGGGGGVYDNGGLAYQSQHAPPMGAYTANAFPELRTKGDLLTIDQFLEQLQHTVFENPTEGVGVYQPAFDPIRRPDGGSPVTYGTNMVSTPSAWSESQTNSTSGDTPTLSSVSYQANNSPKPSLSNMSPGQRFNGLSPYPTLPSVNTLDPNINQFNPMLPSGLGPQYEYHEKIRRYSNSTLQRANPSNESQEEKNLAESLKRATNEATDESKDVKMDEGNIKLPGVSEITRGAEEEQQREGSEEAKPEVKEDARTVNIKTIKALREYIAQRLNKGDFQREGSDEGEEQGDGNRTPRAQQDTEMKEEGSSPETQGQTTPKREGASLYPELPSLRPVEA